MNELNVLLWGAGKAGKLMGAALTNHPRVRLVGIAAAGMDSARWLAERFETRAVPVGLTEFDIPVDLVVIATPHQLHEEQAIAAMSTGAHVLLEKPLAISAAGLSLMQDAAKHFRRRIFCAFVQRCNAAMTDCRDYLTTRADDIQGIIIDQMLRREATYFTSWKGDPDIAGGGALINQAIHALDLALYLSRGHPELVNCAIDHRAGLRVEDGVCAMIRTSARWPLMLAASTRAAVPERQVLRINLSDHSVLVVGTEDPKWCVSRDGVEADIARMATIDDDLGPGHDRLIDDVVHTLLGDEESRYHCELPEVLESHWCMYAMYESARNLGALKKVRCD